MRQESKNIYSIILHEEEYEQIRLTVNEFYDKEYLHIRKYYLDFDEVWKPTPKGISMPLDLNNTKQLFIGLLNILSAAESREIILENFKDLL